MFISMKRVVFVVVGLLFLFQFVCSNGITILAENGGHPGVTRSLLSGLRILGVPFEYNIFSKKSDTVIVLSGINYLREAIRLKKEGKIKKLIAGPNLVTRADEYGGICSSPEVDICVVPSEWVKVAYQEEVSALLGRIKVWAAGVNEIFWIPSKKQRSKIIIYWKTESEEFIRQIETVLRKYPFEVVRVRYGKYGVDEFRNYLNESVFAIFVSVSESQGLALAEAWSMNVPTLVWNPEKLVAHGRIYSQVSSAPYLTSSTGYFWKTIDELWELLSRLINNSFRFRPRNDVLEHFTDKRVAQNMLNLISSIR